MSSATNIMVCRVCLDIDVRMYHISEYGLSAMYEQVTGVTIHKLDKLPRQLCWECAARLSSANCFIEKALKTQWILLKKISTYKVITFDTIKSIDKIQHQLKTRLGRKICKVNDYDYSFGEDVESIKSRKNHISRSVNQDIEENIEKDFNAEEVLIDHEIPNETGAEVQAVDVKVGDYTTVYGERKIGYERTHNENVNISDAEIGVSIKIEDTSDEEMASDIQNVKDINEPPGGNQPDVHTERDAMTEDIAQDPHDLTVEVDQSMKNREEIETNRNVFKCCYCYFETYRADLLRRHVRGKHEREMFSCDYCDYQSSNNDHLQRHINSKHTKSESYDCPHCSYKAYRKDLIMKHLNAEHTKSEVYKCPSCSYKGYRKDVLRKHIDLKHSNKEILKCVQCKYKTFYKDRLQRHVNTAHTQTK